MELIGDDRAIVLGALLWMADRLKGEQGGDARGIWTKLGKTAFEAEHKEETPAVTLETVAEIGFAHKALLKTRKEGVYKSRGYSDSFCGAEFT
ncbi:conjugal transfer protein TraD [Mesorhizobium sp. CCNWLW179-1]|uniref:conjugal transfer protein TraD n=1 Tax=unclassified Mesorhizobium TaxID=325217 RepID=UPI0030148A00